MKEAANRGDPFVCRIEKYALAQTKEIGKMRHAKRWNVLLDCV
jgi:hypothetical protein